VEALVLIGGFLFVAVLGYYVIGRLGRFFGQRRDLALLGR